ncbi:E3 ubiquitin-protein ligase ATL42-like [Impatiens glandulifera]|uniref:E3 ubiquitin-protein ligase ATL42-like n=1 Tax=Impatiens glandulifera TaxID=253017 RepID=UPI001FB12D0D|nr:E3 ubiquitin-protein ligase ATL42-like [Impatiens glandulifera]
MMIVAAILILFFNIIFSGEAQYSGTDSIYQDGSGAGAGFQPSLAVVIAVLSIMFSLTFLLLIYARFCHRGSTSSIHEEHENRAATFIGRSASRFSGIDRTVIDSLPFFRFSSLKGTREGLECVVCLSRFEESEILRLLPKCKHAFHIACVDQWLEKHSSCPLCRQKVTIDDLSIFTYNNNNSNSLRQDSSLELFVERESTDSQRIGSNRFSLGGSFRKMMNKEKGINSSVKEDEKPIQEEDDDKFMHRFNHRIVVNDFVLKNRWSNVSSSDLMFLNSEMIGAMSSNRFSQLELSNKEVLSSASAIDDNHNQSMSIKEEMGRKREFEIKLNKMNYHQLPVSRIEDEKSKIVSADEKRSMSEIVHPRFRDLNLMKNYYVKESSPSSSAINYCESSSSSNVNGREEEERRRRIWLPIARRTVQWFVNREVRRSPQHNSLSSNLNV